MVPATGKAGPTAHAEQEKPTEASLKENFHELGKNACALFNTMVAIGSRPAGSPPFRRDRPASNAAGGVAPPAAPRTRFRVTGHL